MNADLTLNSSNEERVEIQHQISKHHPDIHLVKDTVVDFGVSMRYTGEVHSDSKGKYADPNPGIL